MLKKRTLALPILAILNAKKKTLTRLWYENGKTECIFRCESDTRTSEQSQK
jgi:hypothetical protein